MKVVHVCVLILLAVPGAGFAQKKQLQELQRDMALLQDEVRGLGEKLAALTEVVQQTLDRVNETNTTVAMIDSSLQEGLKQQQKELTAPIAQLGTKVDQMSDEFRYLKESVADMGSRVTKLQTQVTDLKSAMQILSAPPAPPAATTAEGTVPAVSGATLFDNALRDQFGGKPDLALSEYQDFLKSFPNSDLAPAAQFHIGEIHYNKGDFQAAYKAFDLVLEKYPDNDKTPDAMFMKAMSLAQAGQRRSAAVEYRALVKKYPDSEVARKAQEELKKLGY